MTYQPLHRKPRWHDRPRAWLRTVLNWACGTLEEDQAELTDDHGNHIGGDLPPVRNREMIIAGKCESCWAQNQHEGCDWASCGCNCHDDDVHEDWDEPDAEPQVIRTTEVGGVHLPNLGHDDPLPVNPRANCAFAREVMPVERAAQDELHLHDVPRRPLADVPRPEPGGSPTGATSALLSGRLGPGYRQNVSRPGKGVPEPPAGSAPSAAGPGHLTMWDLIQVRSPWPPRTWPPIVSGPRIRPELRAALLAGTT